MSLFKTSAWSLVIVMVGAVVGFISQKLYALYIGAEGLLLIGNFNNFSSIVYIAASGGIYAGIVNRMAEAGSEEEQDRLLTPVFSMLFFFSILTSLVLFLTDSVTYPLLYLNVSVSRFVNILFYLSLPLIILSNGILYVMNGRRKVAAYSMITVAVHLINLGLTWYLVKYAFINGALLSLFLPAAFGFFLMLAAVPSCFKWPSIRIGNLFHQEIYRSLAGFSLVSILGIVLLSLSQLFVRDYIASTFTIAEAAYWQVLSNFSKIWMAVITGVFSMYFFPLVSSLTDRNDIAREVKKMVLAGLPALFVAFALFFVFRRELINLVYSPYFSGASEYMVYQLAGDLLRTVGMVFAYVFLAKGQLKPYALSEVAFTCVYVILSSWLGRMHAMEGVFTAYVISYLFYIFMQLWLYSRMFSK